MTEVLASHRIAGRVGRRPTRVVSASAITGTRPARDTRFGSSNVAWIGGSRLSDCPRGLGTAGEPDTCARYLGQVSKGASDWTAQA